jgi:gentisate 1,2-dioxygenase
MSEATTQADLLARLDERLSKSNMIGQWTIDHLLEKAIGGPTPSGVPFIWRWDDVQDALIVACDALPESTTARRTIAFLNPGLQRSGTTHTLMASMQMVLPGELAWAHRHAIAALRFGVEGGPKLFTVVDGEALPMEPNDLILTPAWCWHDHHNESDSRGVWLDVLDLPLVGGLGQLAYATFGETAQPIREQRPTGGGGLVRPGLACPLATSAPRRYPWSDVEQRLSTTSPDDDHPADGVKLEYLNPTTGGSVFPAMSCNVQMLRPGFRSLRHRRTSSAVCYVIEGEGRTIVGDQEIVWGARDVFALPPWMWLQHINGTPHKRALLFVVDDAPLLKTMGLYRQEEEPRAR